MLRYAVNVSTSSPFTSSDVTFMAVGVLHSHPYRIVCLLLLGEMGKMGERAQWLRFLGALSF